MNMHKVMYDKRITLVRYSSTKNCVQWMLFEVKHCWLKNELNASMQKLFFFIALGDKFFDSTKELLHLESLWF